MFQVSVTNLKPDKGTEVVKQYRHIFDAQSVWLDLFSHMKKSTTVKINTRKIFQYITNIRIGDSSWRCTIITFLSHWTEQIRIHDDNIESTGELSDEDKRQFLENTV